MTLLIAQPTVVAVASGDMLADTLRNLAGQLLKDEDGQVRALELLPPATDEEIRALEARLPCPIPGDVRAALRVTTGLANGPLESFSLVDLEGFGVEELLPFAYSIAHDGYGNYWVLDLLPETTDWGPVFYACHDPAVLAWQAPSIEAFLLDVVAMESGGARSPVDIVHEDVVHRIWRDNPGLMPKAAAVESGDPEVRAFAASLPESALVADLRTASLGDGVSWGRFGPKTEIRRHGSARIWGLVPPASSGSMFARLFGR